MIKKGKDVATGTGDAVDYGATALAFIDKLDTLKSKSDVLTAVQAALSDFGFENFVMTELPSPYQTRPPEVLLMKPPVGWSELYINKRYQLADPIVYTCRHSSKPFEWDEARFNLEQESLALEIMQRARDFRMVHGFVLPIHGLNGTTSCFSMSSSAEPYLNRYTKPAIHLMALYAYERARTVEADRLRVSVLLTEREREVLTWAAAGKSAAAIAGILNITERTAVAHTVNAMQKLGATNKTQAVARALHKKLISI